MRVLQVVGGRMQVADARPGETARLVCIGLRRRLDRDAVRACLGTAAVGEF
jgi:hypothetical protein